MAVAEEYVLKFQADIKDLNSKIGSAQNSIDGLDRKASMAGASFKKMGLALGGVLGTGKIIGDFMRTAQSMDEMGKAAARIGISTDVFSELAYGAELADVQIGSLQNSLKFMQINMAEAAGGSKAATAAFDALGLSTSNLINLPANEQFYQIISALEGVENATLRTKLAQEIFGRAGQDMLNIVNEGAVAMRAAGQEARDFGLIVTDEAARAADEFNDSLLKLKKQYQGVLMDLANTGNLEMAVSAIGDITTAVVTLLAKLGELGLS